MHVDLRIKNPLFMSDFTETWISRQILEKNLKYQILWKSVNGSWVVSCARTKMSKLIVALLGFANAPNTVCSGYGCQTTGLFLPRQSVVMINDNLWWYKIKLSGAQSCSGYQQNGLTSFCQWRWWWKIFILTAMLFGPVVRVYILGFEMLRIVEVKLVHSTITGPRCNVIQGVS